MSYFPERRSGIDPAGIADALSESFSNQYGSWTNPGWYGNEVKLDPRAVVGNNAISAYSPSGYVIEQGDMVFNLATPLDLSSFEKFQFLIAASVGAANDNLVGTGRVLLTNGNLDKYAEASFQFSKYPSGGGTQYQQRTLLQTDFHIVEWVGTFDWTKITQFIFLFDTKNRSPYTWDGYTILIDGGPFFLVSSAISKLGILAEDANGNTITYGKHMQLISPSGGTESLPVPWGPLGVSIGTWTVTILDADFVKWKDGDTNKTRGFTVGIGQTIIGTAVFQSAPPNGGGGGANIPLLVGSASIIAVALIYLLTRKR